MKLHEYTTLILGNHNDENGENCSPKNKYQEEENTEIHDMVHAANLTPDQLAELLRMAAKTAPNPQMLMETVKEDKQNED